MPRKTSKVGDIILRWNEASRTYSFAVPIAGSNRHRWITTRCRNRKDAEAVVVESGANQLVHLANAKAVSEAAIQIITTGRKVTCREILGLFVSEAEGRWAPSMISEHRIRLESFFNFCNCGARPLVNVDRKDVLAWVNHSGVYGTRKNRMSTIRAFYRYARARNFVLENPADVAFVERRAMSHAEMEPKVVQPFTEEEYHRIMSSEHTSDFWRAATAIAYWTGLRFSDTVCLEWSSVSGDELIVWTRKRGRRVALPLNDPLLGGGALLEVLGAARAWSSSSYIFELEREQFLSGRRSRFPTAFSVLLRKLGIVNRSFHSTRHAAISRMRAAGKSLEEIGRLVAHADTETTQNYVHAEG